MDIKNSKPKIILTSSLTTGRRFVKKQNMNGVPLMNFSIYTPSMLLKEKLIRLKPNYRLINDDESAYLLLTLIRQNDYQLKGFVPSFGAASSLLEVINDYRLNENKNFTLVNEKQLFTFDPYKSILYFAILRKEESHD